MKIFLQFKDAHTSNKVYIHPLKICAIESVKLDLEIPQYRLILDGGTTVTIECSYTIELLTAEIEERLNLLQYKNK